MTSSLQLYGGQQLELKSASLLAERIAWDAKCLVAVAVDTALRRGDSWQDIAVAAGVNRASATARWGGSRVSELLAARLPPPMILRAAADFPARPVPCAPRVPCPRTSGRVAPGARRDLGAALRTLRRASRTSLSEAAAVTGQTLEQITDIVEGRTVRSWPVTYTVAHALGGEPQDLLHLWEHASGERLATHGSNGTDRLAAALRGAWLAAGGPSPAIVSDVDVAVARATLCGRVVPPWPMVSALLAGFGADPAAFEQLWVVARATQLESDEQVVPS
ncbi:helix-turn-helix domain-containing protein [Streptomyces sp. NBC_01471]|uniref:hypothetical protein n=1 Tax=Streptomyces sp. NBC_01471 TaxID=2903879 RepID=UPI00324C5183